MSDKYVSKEYAKINGFKVAKTYQIAKYPNQINFSNKNYVIKPLDLCDSHGVFLIKNNINIKTGEKVDKNKIINQLYTIRSKIFNEYYMHDSMYDGLIPYSGYIVEELLLDNDNNIPSDYKCYVFGGKLYFTAVTFNRKTKNKIQTFNSVWFNRDWKPMKYNMIKKGYKYQNLEMPKEYNKMVKLVEQMGKTLKRHCRIDVYLINGEVYLGEYTFFCGAILHSFYCNLILGYLWLTNPDDYSSYDKKIDKLIPSFYNLPNLR